MDITLLGTPGVDLETIATNISTYHALPGKKPRTSKPLTQRKHIRIPTPNQYDPQELAIQCKGIAIYIETDHINQTDTETLETLSNLYRNEPQKFLHITEQPSQIQTYWAILDELRTNGTLKKYYPWHTDTKQTF